MGILSDTIKEWAEQQWDTPEFKVFNSGDRSTLKLNLSNDKGFSYRVFFEVHESLDTVVLYFYAPFKVPADKRAVVTDALGRANFAVVYGHIDLNMADGELRFCAGYDLEDGQLSGKMLDNLLQSARKTMDKYLPAISEVIYAGVHPILAIAKARGEETAAIDTDALATNNAATVLDWSRIPGADVLQAWAQELKLACPKQDAQDWRLVGRAVVWVAEDPKRCQTALQRLSHDAGMRFVNIEDAEVMDLPPPAAFANLAPALIFLEPGGWLQDPQKDDSDEEAERIKRFQRRLKDWIDAFDPAQPVVLSTMVYALGDMSRTIDTPGSFDRYFLLPPPSDALRGTEFLERLGSNRCAESLTSVPAKLGKLISAEFKRGKRLDMALLYLQRLARRENRPIEFLDLMHLTTHGFGEEGLTEPATDAARREVAVHEAGHVAMAILNSAGCNVPEYCSIVPGVGFSGVVADAIARHHSAGKNIAYADFRHEVRVGLSGRAAEELVFGPERVSNGASEDLAQAWRRASQAFSRWGFAPQMEQPAASASNLAVIVGDPTPSESAHLEGLIREFFATEYAQVLQQLSTNRPLLNAITERLLTDPIMDQADLKAICQSLPGVAIAA
ncbi:MAG: YbjN domain-containing protein [Rhodoferax sp.]|nr:YbjN domain-containing protein [Rhodoferax sp.]